MNGGVFFSGHGGNWRFSGGFQYRAISTKITPLIIDWAG